MKRIIKSFLKSAIFILLIFATGALAQVNQSNYRLQFAKGGKSAVQSRSIKKTDVHDIFFRAKKGQRISIKITSTNDAAHFNFGAMHEFDVEPIKDNANAYAGKLPFAGNGEYVIRVETAKTTKYTLTVSIK